VYQRLFWQVEGLDHRDQVVQVHGLLGDVAELHVQPLGDLEMLHRPLLVAEQPGFFVVRGTEQLGHDRPVW